ncbi:uncharacterized protein LOC107981322 isoform X2 [Nasonia vitripennis]|uniref:Uncharacterized protein n=1 Tax=Nasonia vitripennis TaxID=7425 RepID=A0A7M7QIQ4_NASVI|nr:uncharacterized protein LOC107981322 isoform X2 [Nasonia vitripennis]
MKFTVNWLLLPMALNLCTCGGRTECVKRSKLAVIANLQTKRCENNVNDFFYTQDADNNLPHKYNFDYKGLTIGLIGPEKQDNLNVSQKITSALEIPHIVPIHSSTVNTHQILPLLDPLIIKGLFKLIGIFGWTSFFMQSNSENDLINKIVHQFTIEASSKKYCLLTNKDSAVHFIFLGTPNKNFFNDVHNSTIIFVSDKNLDRYMTNYNSTNTFLILDNLMEDNDLKSEEYQLVLKKKMPMLNKKDKLFFVTDAIKIYVNAINSLCESNNCYINKDLKQWNEIILDKITSKNHNEEIKKTFFTYKLKSRFGQMQSMGKIMHLNNDVEIYWNNHLLNPSIIPNQILVLNDFKDFFITSKTKNNCAQNIINFNEINKVKESNIPTTVIISELTESEWWTMVGTVAGVGIAMFAVGFIAVYIIYTNIRGPTIAKGSGREDLDRDSSLRRVGSDRQPSSNTGRSSRVIRGLQRRDSRSSIRSNISDKSV